MKKSLLLEIISSLIVLMFVYAATSKLFNIPQFNFELHRQPLPKWSLPILLWSIPISEIATSILLIMPKTRALGFYGTLVLMISFSIYILLGILKVFDKVPCSCGGIIKYFNLREHLVFNLFFVLIAIIGLIIERKGMNNNAELSFSAQ